LALAHTLSPDEVERARRYRHAPHRDRFVARRGMLRWLGAGYLGCAPESLRFLCDGFGKPSLQRTAASELAFSVSQTQSMALLAFAWDCRVGVDVEQVVEGVDLTGAGQGVFSVAEERALHAAQPASAAAFFSTWTRKEALLKAVGTGLSPQASRYTTQDDRQHESHWRASHNGLPLAGWTFLDLMLTPSVRAALAVSRCEAQVGFNLCTPWPA
jgi:4'-phosphopantetheinyl transferase